MKEYLGDSVYAEWNGEEVILTTDNGEGPSNIIIFDRAVFHSLESFYRRATFPPIRTVKQQFSFEEIKSIVLGHAPGAYQWKDGQAIADWDKIYQEWIDSPSRTAGDWLRSTGAETHLE